MSRIARRTLMAAGLAAAAPVSVLAQDKSTLSGSGQSSIERFLTLQEGALQANRQAQLLGLQVAPRHPVNLTDRILMWNEISLDANALDYVPPVDGSGFHQQFGPHKSSRAIAVVQLAVFEVVNAKSPKFKSYAHFTPGGPTWSADAAVAQAARDALVHLYPPQTARLNAILAEDLIRVTGAKADIDAGRQVGSQAFQAVLSALGADNTALPEPSIGTDYMPSGAVGEWDVDPISRLQVALGANWPKVTPLTFSDQAMFRALPPPAIGSAKYEAALLKTKMLGGDPMKGTQSKRTKPETFVAKLWSYDGTPGLCAPPRLYNQISRQLAVAKGIVDPTEMARFLAIINVAMADAAVSAWEAKYHYKYWRPVTGIRYAKEPHRDPTWYPLGAQATNTVGPNITPPFPAYPSGHATFGGALFTVLRSYMQDHTAFTFVSDEFNGKNKDVYGALRPRTPVHFASLTEAEASNAESRIYDGVHWQFDGDEGIAQGRRVGAHVLKTFALKL